MYGEDVIVRVEDVISRSGMTKKDFAEAIGIDGPKLAKSLTGVRRFTSTEYARIADQGEVTVDWLLHGTSSRDKVLAHRAAPYAVQAIDLVGREMIDMLVEKLDGLVTLKRTLDAPELPTPPERGSYVAKAKHLVHWYQKHLGGEVGGLDTTDLIDRIEDRFGIDVVVTDLPPACDGLSFSDADVRLIILATTSAPNRQRFTLAHELAHIAFNDSREVIEEQLWDQKTTAESRANTFAASFLAPRDEIIRYLNGRTAKAAFDDLVLHFQLSPNAMSWRLLNEDLISKDEQERLADSTAGATAMKAGRAAEHSERTRGAQARRPPKRIVNAYLQAHSDGIATLRPAASLLGEPLEQLETIFLGDASADDSYIQPSDV